jgi:hypothetical protein
VRTLSPPVTSLRFVLVSSAVAFVCAALLEITLHELAHGIAAVVQGSSPIVYGNSVDPGPQTDTQTVVTALAGPVFSLVSGLLILALPTGRLPAFWRLAVLWLGLLSVQTFAGYLITGPFMAAGDIGQVLALSPAPTLLAWAGFVVGWLLTCALGGHAVGRLTPFLTTGQPLAPGLRAVGLNAWLLGALGTILLSLGVLSAGGVPPAIVAFEAFGMATAGIFLFFVRLFLPVAERARRDGPRFSVPVAGIVVAIVLAVLRQVVLAQGLQL